MLEFVKVIHNEDDRKQAVFMLPPNLDTYEQYFLYSFVNNEVANETMVFRCDKNGDVDNHDDLISDGGYVPSAEIMKRLVDLLVSKGELLCSQNKYKLHALYQEYIRSQISKSLTENAEYGGLKTKSSV